MTLISNLINTIAVCQMPHFGKLVSSNGWQFAILPETKTASIVKKNQHF